MSCLCAVVSGIQQFGMATLCCHVLCVDVIALTQREVASAVSLSSYLLIMAMILSIETGHIQAIMDFFTASVRS